MAEKLLYVPIDRIRPNPEQPRHHFATTALDELTASIRAHGIMSPLVARRDLRGEIVLIAGERRLRAAAQAGLREVPVVFYDAPGEVDTLELALVENLQRADLDALDAAEGYQRLIRHYGHTQEQVAVRVGKDRATVANTLRLLKLPAAGRDALRKEQISAGHARALLALEDDGRFDEVLRTVISRALNVRATEALIRSISRQKGAKPSPDRSLVRASDRLSRRFDTRVELKSRKDGGGKVVLHFSNPEDLDRLLARLEND